MIDVLLKTTLFFAILGLGYVAARTKFFPEIATQFLTKFVFYFVLPATVAATSLLICPVASYSAAVIIAAAALPVAGNIFILATHYGVAPMRVSASIFLSTVISVVTISVVIALVTGLYS